jgi:predicted nucleic acid-binding protein
MATIVVDASALGAVVFHEPSSDEMGSRLDAAERVVAPALIWFELANVCRKKIRRHPDQKDWLLDRLTEALELPVEVEPVEHRAAVELACETGLTAYDASYLWLSRTLSADLITLNAMLRIPVDLCNVPKDQVFRPPFRSRVAKDEFDACKRLGPVYS